MSEVRLINGDCIVELPKLSDKSVELVVTDIPYAEVNRKSNGLRSLDKGGADIETFRLSELLPQLLRVCKGSFYIFCGINQISEIRSFFSENGLSTRLLVWEKTNPSPMNGDSIWLSGVEFCVYAKFPHATYNGHCKNCVLKYPSGRNKIHPTEKNIKLFDEIITTSSNEGDWVLDCCLGSGTTAISCLKNNRNCIGIELNNDYFQIARDRVIAEEANQTLF